MTQVSHTPGLDTADRTGLAIKDGGDFQIRESGKSQTAPVAGRPTGATTSRAPDPGGPWQWPGPPVRSQIAQGIGLRQGTVGCRR